MDTNGNTKNISDYILAIKRRKFRMVGIMALVFILACIVAVALPSIYRSKAVILIEQQEIPEDLVRSTVTSYADQRIEIISQQVMRSQNLFDIMDKYGLYTEELEKEPREVVLDMMREDIERNIISADVVDPRSGRPTRATIAFSVSFDYKSPELSQKVANELTSLFLNENLENRTQMATETSSFLTEEVSKLEKLINELEAGLASFKEENAGKLPELMDINLKIMERSENEITEVDRQIQVLEERIIYVNSEMAQINPSVIMYNEYGERIQSPKDRIKALESRLISLRATYSEQHPDVQRALKELDGLQKEVSDPDNLKTLQIQLQELQSDYDAMSQQYSDEHPDMKKLKRQIEVTQDLIEKARQNIESDVARNSDETKSDNPVFIQLMTTKKAAQSEIRALRDKRLMLQKKIDDYEQRLLEMPGVEREYNILVRDYNNAMLKYREIRAKEMEAKLAESLETGRKAERFTLIEPPMLPEEPISPNRKLIVVLGLFLAIGGGLGMVILMDSMDTTLRGRKMVMAIAGAPPLAVIPEISTRKDDKKKRVYLWLALAGVLLLFGLMLLGVHLFYKPLDVLWYVLLRKFG